MHTLVNEGGIHFDVIGTCSAGAINGSFVATGPGRRADRAVVDVARQGHPRRRRRRPAARCRAVGAEPHAQPAPATRHHRSLHRPRPDSAKGVRFRTNLANLTTGPVRRVRVAGLARAACRGSRRRGGGTDAGASQGDRRDAVRRRAHHRRMRVGASCCSTPASTAPSSSASRPVGAGRERPEGSDRGRARGGRVEPVHGDDARHWPMRPSSTNGPSAGATHIGSAREVVMTATEEGERTRRAAGGGRRRVRAPQPRAARLPSRSSRSSPTITRRCSSGRSDRNDPAR